MLPSTAAGQGSGWSGTHLAVADSAVLPVSVSATARVGVASVSVVDPWIDTWDRAAVVAAYGAEFERTEPDAGFTGDVEACVAGTTSQDFRDSELRRVNWFRRMAGLGVVAEDASYTADAQQAALMMAANGDLSHFPDPEWPCYTAQGARGAARSNLALGRTGVGAIGAYMRDDGYHNTPVGHRRWILSPYVQTIGMGDAIGPDTSDDYSGWRRYANALYVVGDLGGAADRLREAREFVAWPPSGYVPAATVWQRWSFALFDSVDFSAASVTVTNDTGAVPVEIVNRNEGTGFGGAGSRALVWRLTDLNEGENRPEPTDGDECYTVTISGVRAGGLAQDAYEYRTCLLDLSAEPPDPGTPSAPQNLEAADVGHDSVTLSWILNPQPEGVTVISHLVERLDGANWIELHSSPTPLTNYTARGLAPSTEYRFRVRLDTTHGDASATVTVTTETAPIDPVVPGRAQVTARGGVNEFTASWSAGDGGSPITHWQVATGPFGARFAAATTNYRWSDQRAGRYTVRVRACNRVGCGPEGTATVAVTDPAAVVPGRAQVTARGGVNEFIASWSAGDGGSPITHWQVTTGPFGARFAAATTSYRWSDQRAGRYTVRVRACNRVGCGPEGSATVAVTDPAAVVPGRAQVTARVGVNEFSAGWSAGDGGSPITHWQVTTGPFGARFAAATTSYRWSDQRAGRYTVRVRACNRVGCGPEGSATVAVTDPAAVVPGRAQVTARVGVNEFSAGWSAGDGGSPITHWQVTTGPFGARFAAATTNYRWTDQHAGRYTVRVRACNRVGCGPEGTATVTVTDPPTTKRVILSVGAYAGAGSPRQLAGCSSQHCYFMQVDLEGFDRSGTYDVQCHHRGIPGSSAGTWSGTLRNSTWPMQYRCSFGYPGHTVFVRVRDPETGRFIDSNDIVWPSYGRQR